MEVGAAQLLGDPNTGGGTNKRGSSTVIINGKPAGLPLGNVSPCSNPIHIGAMTKSTCQTVMIDYLPALRTFMDYDSCGHARSGGSPNVIIKAR